jgi:hypothetical protein
MRQGGDNRPTSVVRGSVQRKEPAVSDDEQPPITTIRRDDGTWDVVRRDGTGEEVLSSHPHEAGATSEAYRLADRDVDDAAAADRELTEGQGAQPDQSGG